MKDSNVSTHPAVIAVWAALIAVATLAPTFPIIGTGATFSINAALVPLAGIMFGPISGAVCAAVGTFIGQLIAPHTVFFGPLTFLIPTLNALCAGFAMRKKWYVPMAVTILLTLAWFAFPLGRAAWFQPAIWSMGILASLIGWLFASDWIADDDRNKRLVGIFLAAMAGTTADHALGSVWALALFELPPEAWLTALPLAPLERILFSLGAAIIGAPLLVGLPKVGVLVGPELSRESEHVVR